MEQNGGTASDALLNGDIDRASNGDSSKLDTNLYSRQIYALGESAMMRLRSASVLICGMGGVGVEVAKNLVLGGVHKMIIQDTQCAGWLDLSAQYYIHESELGENRAKLSHERLAELNDTVKVECITEALNEQMVANCNLTILTNSSLSEQLQVNEWTRKHNTLMIVVDSRGLFGQIFVDLGSKFRVDDANGEPCSEVFIEYVDKNTGDVLTLENFHHGLEDGDYVTFSEVKGMTELNGIEPLKVTIKKANIFNIDSDVLSKMGDYLEGGRAKQVKVPKEISFKSLTDSLETPELLTSDFAKFDRPQQLHHLWLALHKFVDKHKRLPRPRSVADADELASMLPKREDLQVDRSLLEAFSFQATGNLCPMTSFMGGVAAQEAMKAITHHMMPIRQFFYFDALEALPDNHNSLYEKTLTEEQCQPRSNRYDGQAVVFGWRFQEALLNQKWFIVGAGAIGCELLKNFAMIGLAASDKKSGLLKITDMDQIEISNLNRQFLFRKKDVGSLKSDVAAKAVTKFNEHLNIESLGERVGNETENVFNDAFFHQLNGVANALDNVPARRYMDLRCVYYGLPLLESGTMGAKGNTQVVFPYLTESYGSSADPPEKSIPICTLKNFPNEIQHTIQWARDLFEGLFASPAEIVNQFIEDERAFMARLDTMNMGQKLELLETVRRALIDDKPSSVEECIEWARVLWQSYYHNPIAQLIFTFPPDQMTEHGVKFWSGMKRCPHPLNFDVNCPEHLEFVHAASILRAQQYGLKQITDISKVAELAAAVVVAPFVPSQGAKIAVTDTEAQEQSSSVPGEDAEERVESSRLALAKLTKRKTPLVPIDFEKDDDSNYHMQFITAASNLRAENYDIPKADRMKTKQIAGRIIPAIATTTAAVAGLVTLELYKMIDFDRLPSVPLDRFKNGFLNLAVPFFGFSEPIAAPKKTYCGHEFTLWNQLELQGPKTLREMVDWFKTDFNLNISMLSCGVSLLYSFFLSEDKKRSRLAMSLEEVVRTVSGKEIPTHVNSLVLEVMADDNDGNEVETPYVKYNLQR